jgi:hypothetical protein
MAGVGVLYMPWNTRSSSATRISRNNYYLSNIEFLKDLALLLLLLIEDGQVRHNTKLQSKVKKFPLSYNGLFY